MNVVRQEQADLISQVPPRWQSVADEPGQQWFGTVGPLDYQMLNRGVNLLPEEDGVGASLAIADAVGIGVLGVRADDDGAEQTIRICEDAGLLAVLVGVGELDGEMVTQRLSGKPF